MIHTEMKPPKLVRCRTTALAAKDQHAARQSARRVTVKRPGARFILQHRPRCAIDVPSPAIVSFLKVRHPTVDVHCVAVQNRRVLMPRSRSAFARREQMPRFSLCNIQIKLEALCMNIKSAIHERNTLPK